MSAVIDLNADLGEGCGSDAALLQLITSCSIACGGHTGDAASIERALADGAEAGVALGAHPSYPDRAGFGRTKIDISNDDLAASLRQQIDGIAEIATRLGVRLSHIKPHGALYHAADGDAEIASMLAELARDIDAGLYGPPGGALARRADAFAVPFAAEGFADRGYRPDGRLLPRGEPGATLAADAAASQALAIARGETIETSDGATIRIAARTICLHGDDPHALANACAVRSALDAAGVTLKAPFA